MGNLDPKVQEILGKHLREKSKFPRDPQPKTNEQSLEEMFGKEVAARMRREAFKNASEDNLPDP